MTIRKRLERLEGALGTRSKTHLVNPTEWPAEEQVMYDEGTDQEKEAMIRAHVPALQEGDVVVLWSVPRPRDEESEP